MNKQEEARFNPFMVKTLATNKIKYIIACGSGKGGVGKSVSTSLLAIAANKLGYKVGIMDADITGPSIARMFGVSEFATMVDNKILPAVSKNHIKIISSNMMVDSEDTPILWRGPLVVNAIKEFYGKVDWQELDFLFIDMPPGTGEVALTLYQSLPLDGIVLVTTPSDLVNMIVSKAVNMAFKMNVPILGIIENMAYFKCECCDHITYPFKSIQDINLENYGVDKLLELPIDGHLNECADRGEIEQFNNFDLIDLIKDINIMLKG